MFVAGRGHVTTRSYSGLHEARALTYKERYFWAEGGIPTFCTNCGQYIEEGKAFCKHCGAPVLRSQETPAQVPTEPESPPSAPAVPLVQPPVPSAPLAYLAAPPEPPIYAAVPPKNRRGLIAGLVAAVIVFLAAAGVGSYYAFFRGGEESDLAEGTTTTAVSGYSTSTVTTSIPGTVTTLAGGSTTQTVPGLTTSSQVGVTSTTALPTTTSSTTGVTEDPVQVYLAAAGRVASELENDDSRIPELAKIINDTIPKVPQGVRTELLAMLNGLDRLKAMMRDLVVPSPFVQAHYWLDEALAHMTRRVQATIKGVEAVWAAGKADAKANDFFEQGRKERDAYREAMRKYYENLPLE